MSILNQEIGNFLFSALIAIQSDQEYRKYYLTSESIQTMASDSSVVNDEKLEKIKSINQKKWQKEIDNQYQFFHKELAGQTLTYDKTNCDKNKMGKFKILNCNLDIFLGENENKRKATLYANVIFINNDTYKLADFRKYINKQPSIKELNAIKNKLKPYANILQTNQPLQIGFKEYASLANKAYGETVIAKPKAKMADIAKAEKRINMPFPDDLKSFYLDYANGAHNEIMHIQSTEDIKGIIDFIKDFNLTENIDEIKNIQHFNDKLMVFAYNDDQPMNLELLMFDKQGNVYGYEYWDDGSFGNALVNLSKLKGYSNFSEKTNTYLNTLKLELIFSELKIEQPKSQTQSLNDIFNPNL